MLTICLLLAELALMVGCDQPQSTLPAAYPQSTINANPQPASEDQATTQGEQTSTAVPNRDDTAETYTISGMVGQVNGNPIYADEVLKPVKERLAALGRQLDRSTFRDRVGEIVQSQLRSIIVDALILGQAKRDLTKRQRQGLQQLVQRRREKLLREYGQGSEALAKANIRKQTGKALDKTLEDYRKQRVVQRFLRRKIRPKIHVTRRDIARYYHDHLDKYQPPTTRRLRLIRVDSQSKAGRIKQQLNRGQSFQQVAGDQTNENMPSTGGLMTDVIGNNPLRYKPLNQAIGKLDVHQWAGPIEAGGDHWFVYLAKIDNPEGTSLMDAQHKIERQLRLRRYRSLSENYRRKLLKTGSYNSISEMTQSVVDIAVNRYASQ